MKDDIIIKFKFVNKKYKLFESEEDRLKALVFSKKNYNEKKAVNNISFDIRKGESVAFLGKNGAGKSTILKLITGVTHPTSGIIRIGGKVSALLELTAGFNGDLTGRENIYYRGELLGLKYNEISKLEEKIVSFAELGEYIDQPVRMYSSGMKARLGFALNVSIDPDILIVDEALSVGDNYFKEKCNKKIKELLNEGKTFLFVTHSAAAAKKFCKRGIVIRKGNLVYDGDIEKAIAFYKTMN